MYSIGVDLGGTNIAIGLVDEKGCILDKRSIPTRKEREADAILQDIAMLCIEIIEKNALKEKQINAIGIGVPGKTLPLEGIILSASNLHLDDINVKNHIQKYINIPVYVENDANCAALAEVLVGAAEGEKDVIVVTLGTGIGGGIIIDGQIYRGAFSGAGEIGHQVIALEGHTCGCGRKGCWEQYASATALIRDAKQAAKANPNTKMIALTKEEKIENITPKQIFEAMQLGDETAAEVLNQYFQYVANGLTNLINILEPSCIILGGGISAQKEVLTEPIKKYVQQQMYGGLPLKTEIKSALLGNDAGIIGAALLETTFL